MRLIYLHGFASGPSSKKANYFRRRFAEHGVEIEIPDLAEGDFEGLTLSGQLRVIERIARDEEVSLMGSSLGGYLAALYAARHPEVEKVVLMAPAFGFLRRWVEGLGEQRQLEWKQTGKLAVYHYGDGGPRDLGYGIVEDGAQYEERPGFRQPGLIFHGDKDSVVPVECSKEFAAESSNVRLEVLDSDHELLNVLDLMWMGSWRFLSGGGSVL